MLIPAVGLTLISYFRLNKRYRCTRNRIVSIVMHLIVMFLGIAVLAGFTIEYHTPDTEREVILLVDVSKTTKEMKYRTDDFVRTVIDNCDSLYKLGIVKFGYDQVYAVELSSDTSKMYSTYTSSADPDITATDIASALTYSASLFETPENARIVLMTDALETDSLAENAIKTLVAKGISVDTVYIPGEDVEQEVQIVDATQSVSKVEINTPFNMNVTVQSSYAGTATITPYDNKIAGEPMQIVLQEGLQTISIPYTFAWGGMHVMSFEVEAEGDTLAQNNTYFNHIYIETFTEILVVESIDDESSSIVSMLGEELNVTVVDVTDSSKMPATLDDLRAYDEILLVNVSNEELPAGFDQILYEYVHDIGGGLFTICGNTADSSKDNWTANAYTREDMYGTLYQEMLPVEIVNYTAPVGVVIVVDTSGSMITEDENPLPVPYEESKLRWALQGAQACLDALTERDYVGIMTLSDSYTEELALTPRTSRDKILTAIAELEEAAINGDMIFGSTVFSAAMARAGKALAARSDIEKRHIIIVTDGMASPDDTAMYQYWAKENAKMGITMSIIGVNTPEQDKEKMVDLLVNYADCKEENFVDIQPSEYDMLPGFMREQLEGPEIKSVNYEPFIPEINTFNSVTNGIAQDEMPSLDGYYGVKLKPNATAVLTGKYTPIYSQWDFGNGRVGTFACDLNGTWSADFVLSEVGRTLINSIVYTLFPKENIRVNEVKANITGDNYTTNLSILTDLEEGEYIRVTVTAPSEAQQVLVADRSTGYSRMSFAVKESGMHTIKIQKLDAQDYEIASTTVYKSLSYSKEYDGFADRQKAQALAEKLALDTNGTVIYDALQVFDNAVEYLHVVINPRIVFIIMMIVCFLVDIAARKFKWKWPHEIIQERKRNLLAAK